MEPTGFVGLGAMGFQMAKNLAAVCSVDNVRGRAGCVRVGAASTAHARSGAETRA